MAQVCGFLFAHRPWPVFELTSHLSELADSYSGTWKHTSEAGHGVGRGVGRALRALGLFIDLIEKSLSTVLMMLMGRFTA